jgi:hypothetical protein
MSVSSNCIKVINQLSDIEKLIDEMYDSVVQEQYNIPNDFFMDDEIYKSFCSMREDIMSAKERCSRLRDDLEHLTFIYENL